MKYIHDKLIKVPDDVFIQYHFVSQSTFYPIKKE